MVSEITSNRNPRIKYIRSLVRRRARQREGRFVVEGTRLVEEAVEAGIRPALVLYTEAWAGTEPGQRLLPALGGAEDGAWRTSARVLADCADTESPQGVLAVLSSLQLEPRPGMVLVLDGLRDPGNLGTILRSALAASVGLVILAPGTVDLYNPKVVRGAMGAHFRLPALCLDWPAIARRLAGRRVWLADAQGETAYDAIDWTLPSALIVGGEPAGAGREASDLTGGTTYIPMAKGVESLNAAMAATAILFEVARQRRCEGGSPVSEPV
jgi:TrmH family RNA methyltransferase